MKKFLALLVIVLTLVIYHPAAAQNTGSCNSVNAQNYDTCCVIPGDYDVDFQPSQACSDYQNQNDPAKCNAINGQNYERCCTPPSGMFHPEDYEPSGICLDFKERYDANPQSMCAALTNGSPKWLDAGCDKGYLVLTGKLQAMCDTLITNTPRWTNLGCNNATPAGGSIGADPLPTGPQNYANDTGRGTSSKTGSAELSSCSSIKFKSLLDILIWIKCIIVAAIIPLIFVLAFLFFLWGVLRFMMASDQKNKEESKKMVWAGLIGLFVMVSVWGIIKIVGNVLGIESAVPLLQTEYLDENKASR
jgi:hypothetical protein